MQIRRFLKFLFIGIFCVFCISSICLADTNATTTGGNQTNVSNTSTTQNQQSTGDMNWVTPSNLSTYNENLSRDAAAIGQQVDNTLKPGFVPIEVRLGLMFMKALSSIDYVLQISLVRFTILFLFIMYAFWIVLESYKLIRESNDYKEVLYNMFTKGIVIAIWVLILNYGPAKVFDILVGPIIKIGTFFSNLILDAVAHTFEDTGIPDTCSAIHDYVNRNYITNVANNQNATLLIAPETSADIMCLPGRISTFFYYAVAAAFKWILYGLGHSISAIAIGIASVFIFIKCIFKYAFMTLSIVADLFLTLLMLPFTAIAEAMPSTKESSYIGQMFSGFLKLFNTRKLSDVILVFINTTIYFITLSIIIAICAALLSVSVRPNVMYSTASGMTVLLTGCFILYLANKAEEFATQLGGKIDNSFGKQLQSDTKTLWGSIKKLGGMAIKTWLKK